MRASSCPPHAGHAIEGAVSGTISWQERQINWNFAMEDHAHEALAGNKGGGLEVSRDRETPSVSGHFPKTGTMLSLLHFGQRISLFPLDVGDRSKLKFTSPISNTRPHDPHFTLPRMLRDTWLPAITWLLPQPITRLWLATIK
jgi:hypothetical protein